MSPAAHTVPVFLTSVPMRFALPLSVQAGRLPQRRDGQRTGNQGSGASGKVVPFDGPMGAMLSFENLQIGWVPDGRVYLTRGADIRQGIEPGKLRQYSGEVSFFPPQMADAASFDSIVIWGEKFQVEIGRTELIGAYRINRRQP